MRRWLLAAALIGYPAVWYLLGPETSHGHWLHWLEADPERAVVLAVAGAAWLLAGWLFVVIALWLLATTKTAAGRGAESLSRVVTPVAVRRLLEAVLGAAVAVAPAGAAAAGAAPTPTPSVSLAPLPPVPAPIVAPPEQPLPDLDRPSAKSSPAPPSRPPATPPATPSTKPPPPPASASAPKPAPPPPPRSVAPPRLAPPAAATPPTHLVRSGDTLWGLAVAELPAGASAGEITRTWQHWYAVNRSTIGPDPALLFPGELLTVPQVAA